MSSREVLKRLKQAGFTVVRTRGSHTVLKDENGKRTVVVPHPKKDLPRGTLRSIEQQSGVSLT